MSINLMQVYTKEMSSEYKKAVKRNITPEQAIEKIIKLEKKFINQLKKEGKLEDAFLSLLSYLYTYKDLRSIKSYFREREESFKGDFSVLLEEKRYAELAQKYSLNFLFCSFVKKQYNLSSALTKIYNEMELLRGHLITLHLHYAFNRAKIFTKYTGGSLTFSDLVSVATEGLIIAADKYCPDPAKKKQTPFYMVAIGRMVAHLIAAQTASSPVKITYKPSRQLYTIKKYIEANPNATYEEVADYMKMDTMEVVYLLSAVQNVALDDTVGGEMEDLHNFKFVDLMVDDGQSLYEQIENKDLIQQAKHIFESELPLVEKKVCWIMGIFYFPDITSYCEESESILNDLLGGEDF